MRGFLILFLTFLAWVGIFVGLDAFFRWWGYAGLVPIGKAIVNAIATSPFLKIALGTLVLGVAAWFFLRYRQH